MEQIEQSFKEIASNRDTISEEQLRQLLDPEDVEYLITKMDANEDGGFDYKTFVFYGVMTAVVSLDRPTLRILPWPGQGNGRCLCARVRCVS